ncbi:MAG TPA: Gfo/Idh/MocA family oxidoreductase [Edaphobacter sp.]|nr:Gfo/Idh/MocA family oxidoreductase [Edaphobacter sp.]
MISRREFSKLSALGLAAHSLSSLPLVAQSPSRKIGYCVIGLGRIADHHMGGIAQSSTASVTALVSGHRDKAERIAAQYGVPKSSIYSYQDMDRIRDNKAIDAVIVCLPNSMHAEYTSRSAKAGKHVLCEKPMAISVAECEQMVSACKAANVRLMIAYRLHYEPITLKTIKMIRDGAIGKVEAIDSANGFNIAPNEWRSTRALGGGGPLMDVGVYSLNATRYLTGEEPVAFTAVASTIDNDGRFQGVEENLAWTMKFPSGAVASCTTTYGASMPGYYKVFGSKGWLEVDEFGYQGLHLTANYRSDRNTPPTKIDEKNPEPDPKQFARQIDHFSRCILESRTPDTPGEEGLKDIQHIASIYKAAGLSFG